MCRVARPFTRSVSLSPLIAPQGSPSLASSFKQRPLNSKRTESMRKRANLFDRLERLEHLLALKKQEKREALARMGVRVPKETDEQAEKPKIRPEVDDESDSERDDDIRLTVRVRRVRRHHLVRTFMHNWQRIRANKALREKEQEHEEPDPEPEQKPQKPERKPRPQDVKRRKIARKAETRIAKAAEEKRREKQTLREKKLMKKFARLACPRNPKIAEEERKGKRLSKRQQEESAERLTPMKAKVEREEEEEPKKGFVYRPSKAEQEQSSQRLSRSARGERRERAEVAVVEERTKGRREEERKTRVLQITEEEKAEICKRIREHMEEQKEKGELDGEAHVSADDLGLEEVPVSGVREELFVTSSSGGDDQGRAVAKAETSSGSQRGKSKAMEPVSFGKESSDSSDENDKERRFVSKVGGLGKASSDSGDGDGKGSLLASKGGLGKARDDSDSSDGDDEGRPFVRAEAGGSDGSNKPGREQRGVCSPGESAKAVENGKGSEEVALSDESLSSDDDDEKRIGKHVTLQLQEAKGEATDTSDSEDVAKDVGGNRAILTKHSNSIDISPQVSELTDSAAQTSELQTDSPQRMENELQHAVSSDLSPAHTKQGGESTLVSGEKPESTSSDFGARFDDSDTEASSTSDDVNLM